MKPLDDSHLSWLHLPGSKEYFKEFRSFVLDRARAVSLSEEIRTRVDLVLEEVLLNVIHYAFSTSQAEHIAVGCGMTPDKGFLVRVTDPGPPFNPLEQPAPDTELSLEERKIGGMGILLAKSMSSNMAYHRRHGRNILDIFFQD